MDTMRSAGKRGLVLAPVAALLLSVAALLLGNGLLSTLLIVRAGHEGFSTGAISAMMSFYFAGFTIGALVLPPIIVSVGHVRTFAGFAAIASMTALLHVAFVEPIAWMPLRLITGFAYAGMILATESWLNAHALPSTRGQLLSIFGVVSMGSWAIGQALLNIAPPADVTLFLIVSLLISAAVVPITLLPSHPPAQVEQEWVAFRDLVLVSPLAAAGAFLAGLAIGGFWGMGANFAQSIGLDVGGISAFMAAVLGGTLAFHWPLGWLSDRVPRNLVIAGAALASAASAIGVALAVEAPLPLLLAAGALFGGFGIPIYSLCLAVANDDLPAVGYSAPRAASVAQRDRDSRWPPNRSSCNEYRRPWRPVPLCGGVAHAPGSAGHRPQAAEARQPGQGGPPFSEHADDNRISRYDDMHGEAGAGRAGLARHGACTNRGVRR
ncbi:MFS transporter [Escherichia coli]|uniref:MFS transporter n=1 Tax=Escherichia coli TaxID=562 RepID=UPI00201AB838|nr:MFS transporter [Escherichia coli]